MTRSRLIVFEGVAGSGTSTLTRYAGDLLKARSAPHHVILEGDLEHPADYESVTWLPEPGYADLLCRHPSDAVPIQGSAEPHDGGLLVPYGRLRTAGSVGTSAHDALAAHDIYELPEPTYRRLALQRWQAFGKQASAEPDIWVLECCLLQIPITTLLVKHNCDEWVIHEHIRATLDRVIAQRPTAWCDFFVRYHTQQEYGRAHQLRGIEGTVRALAARQRLEEDLLMQLPVAAPRIDTSAGWYDAKSILRELIG